MDFLTNNSSNLLYRELARQSRLATTTNELLTRTLLGTTQMLMSKEGDPEIVNSSLHQQLNLVARLIEGRASHGLKRQVFFCAMGGFDNHGNLLTEHPRLLSTDDWTEKD